MKKTPGSLQLFRAKRKAECIATTYFRGGDPGRNDTDAEPSLNEFFHGFHVACLNDGIEDDLFVGKVIGDHSTGGTGAVIEDITLFVDFRANHMPNFGPRMGRANEELEGVGEERVKIEEFLAPRLEGDRAIDPVGPQQSDSFRSIGLFNQKADLGVDFAQRLDDGWQRVLANGMTGADAEPFTPPFSQVLNRSLGQRHFLKNFVAVVQQLFPSLRQNNSLALAVQQLTADPFFQFPDRVADGRGGDAELARGDFKTAHAREYRKGEELPAIQRTFHSGNGFENRANG